MTAESQRVESIIDAEPDLPWSEWALRRDGLALILEEVAAGRRRVVECGSGVSTIAIARMLRERGGCVFALEHDPGWADLIRARLAAERLGRWARVIDAPLSPHPLAPPGCRWYAAEALAELPDAGIELLLVDGPPAGETAIARSRYPALPVLAPRFADGAAIVLDDIDRAGERWVLAAWEDELGLRFERRAPARVAIARTAARTGRP